MGRWLPGSQERLVSAALALYDERGFEQTAVADIAERAGVTERTFFRYFSDKREVLFAGTPRLHNGVMEAIESQPTGGRALTIMREAMVAGATLLGIERDYAALRSRVIAASPSLVERELLKLATLARNATLALIDRGIPAPMAALAAETGVTIFKVAFDDWIAADDGDIAEHVRLGFSRLDALTGAPEEIRPQ
jgi:AcrR family transcriptional regulator